MKNEPVITVASITAVVAALIGVLVAFGVPLSDDQQKAVLAFVSVAGPVVAALVARRKVTPSASSAMSRRACLVLGLGLGALLQPLTTAVMWLLWQHQTRTR